MPKNIIQYDLLISCPGDITSEINIIENSVSQFNSQFLDALGISIRTKHWQKNSYPQSGGKPQALLNEQFVNDCDAAVAILWTRFGTPTDEYGSGTEEEIEIMLSSGKQVFMYFSDKPISPSVYSDYDASIVTNKRFSPHISTPSIFPGYIPDYSDDFERELSNVFCYSCFDEGEDYIVKLKIDYIKHNTTIAFPTIIFIKEPCRSIPYQITSKNSPEIVSGKIEIIGDVQTQ